MIGATLRQSGRTAFDRIAVTNNTKGDVNRAGLPASTSTLVLQRDSTNSVWRMVWPLDAS
jgi:hypothetical protein